MKAACRPAVIVIAGLLITAPAVAQSIAAAPSATAPMRPQIMFNRWQEDWSVLADPGVPKEPLDGLKYIPLSSTDPKTYLSFGANVRERFESNNAVNFGIGNNPNANYLISRTELHADLRLGPFQIFGQLQSDFAPWKTMLTPVDQDKLDLEQGFIALVEPLGEGTLKVRLGRQQMAFDLQRFVSVRDGPNVRQSFDAAWADYEIGPWRFIGFYSQPVQTQVNYVFDDYSSGAQTFGGARVERKLGETMGLAAYYARFTQDGVRSLFASGNEQRDIYDVHFSGTAANFDWDTEAMGQTGTFANKSIWAWYFGAIGGYTFKDVGWSPRLGLQFDIASGNNDPQGGTLGTFNPLFPNGYYFALAGYTGFPNIIHLKPSLTVHPTSSMTVMLAVAPQWRQTTADAVYTQPNIPVPGTAGQPGSYTGTYGQLRVDWTLTPHLKFALEAVHFAVSDVIRRAGGRDADYVGVQLAFGW
jgi:hypothetical protein